MQTNKDNGCVPLPAAYARMDLKTTDKARLASVRLLFTDIDDTLSDHGKITTTAYNALWQASDAGLAVVPITGRPAGWCDHIARMWPVLGVVGENGGLYFHMTDSGMQKVYAHDAETRAGLRQGLAAIADEILDTIPGCAIASDQFCREYDLSIDYSEDVPPIPMDQVDRIVGIFRKHGANAKISSVHVNGWFGDFDKLSMAKRFALEVCDMHLDQNPGAAAFVGDSPNDEPMFAFFPLSFGVANVSDFFDRIKHRPAFITDKPSGRGFAEVVEAILTAKRS